MSDIAALVADNLDVWTGAIERKSGAGRGGGKRISLYGIDRLRALILDLAVRGKLVPQDAGDEPTSTKGNAKTGQSTPPFAIPQSWQCRPLKSLGRQVGGGTPSKSRMDFWEGPIPWISPKDMKKDYLTEAELSVSEAALQGSSIKMIAPESLLFVVRGMILAHSFPVAISKAPVTINQDMKALELHEPDTAEYLLRALKGLKPLMLARVERSSHGTCRLDSAAYGDFPVPIPPLAEQRRIVARVDELIALCDALERESAGAMAAHQALVEILLATLVNSVDATDLARDWARLESHFDTLFTTEASIDALKQTILDLAVRGKLVKQDAADGDACELLASIAKEKKGLITSGAIKKGKAVEPIDEKMHLYSVPKSWQWRRLGDAAYLVTDGEHLTPKRIADQNAIPLVTAKNVRAGRMDYSVTDFVGRDTAEICWQRCRPRENDILLVSVGATIGRHTIIRDFREMVIVRSVTLIKAEHSFIPYLSCVIGSQMMQTQIWGGVRQSAQPCLYLNVSNALQVPIPPLAEQRRIVAKVDALMALCDELKGQLANAAQTQRHLADAITQRAAACDAR